MKILPHTLQAVLTSAALVGFISLAQAQDENATLSAPKIIQSLSKDIVLDRPGVAQGARPVVQASVNLNVQFAFNSADLLPQGRQQLDELGNALSSKTLVQYGFELAGHTDAVGGAEYNLKLSLERANAVKQYLIVRHGINPNRLVPLGFGFSQLANRADPTAAVNRRVEVRRVALNAQAGVPPTAAMPAMPATMPVAPATGGRLVTTP